MSEQVVHLRGEAQRQLRFYCFDDGSGMFEWWEEVAQQGGLIAQTLRQLVLSAEELEIVRTSVPPQRMDTP
jgi:hypothetical protein